MGEFSEEILGYIPDVIQQFETEAAVRRAEEAKQARAAEAKRQAEQAADERYRALGKEVVHLLQTNRVPTQPIYDRRRNKGPVVQTGNGWPVKFIYTPEQNEYFRRLEVEYIAGSGASPDLYALQDTGVIFRYRRTLYVGNGQYGDPRGKEYAGLVFPDEPLAGQAGLNMIQSDHFKRGIAALIASRK